MNRRGFLSLLVALVVGRKLKPTLKVRAPQRFQVREGGAYTPEGISIRHIRTYDSDGIPHDRMDVLYGFSRIRPEMSCRIVG